MESPLNYGVKNTIVKNLTLPIHQSEKFIYSKRSSDGKNFDDYFKWEKVDIADPQNSTGLNLNYVQNLNNINQTNQACHRKVMDIFTICEKCTNLQQNLDLDPDTCGSILSHVDPDPDNGRLNNRCTELLNARDDPEQVIGFITQKPNETNFYSQVFMHVNFHGGIFFPFRNTIPMVAQALSKPFGASFGEPNIKTWENKTFPSFPTYPLSADSSAPYRYGLLAAKRQVILHELMNEFIKFNPTRFPPNPPDPDTVKKAGFDLLSYMNLKVTGSAGMVLPFRQIGTTDYEVDSNRILSFPARIMEEIAISPDEYDETNFSILTNYMLSAYIRLKESGVKFPTSIDPIGDYIPPDIGHYDGREFLEKIINGTVTRGISTSNTVLKQDYINHLNNFNLKVGSFEPSFFLNYIERQINLAKSYWQMPDKSEKLLDIDYTLTSWVPDMKGDIFTSFAKFRDISSQQRGPLDRDCSSIDPPIQCCFLRITDDFKMDILKIRSQGNYNHLYWEGNKRKHIPHFTHCVSGGRSGFSVKIIHPSTVNEDLLSSERGQHSP